MSANMREDLEAAYNDDEETQENQAEEAGGSSTNSEEQVRVEEKEETPTPQELLAENEPAREEPAVVSEIPNENPVGEDEKPASGEYEKAPAGWGASVREEWSSLSPTVKAEVVRRENAYSAGIQRYAEDGKFGSAIKQTLAPYAQIMAMEGADELTAVGNLARTAAVFRLGSPQEKAGTIADIIRVYGIDISMLDSMLVGESPVTPEETKMQTMLDQRLGPVEQMMKQVSGARESYQSNTVNHVNQEITEFENNAEFMSEVRSDMADLMEMAANRNQTMTLQQAYDKAVLLNPDVSAVLESRNTQKRLKNNATKLKAKEAAASSVTGSIGGEGSNTAADLRSTLADAWEEAVRQ